MQDFIRNFMKKTPWGILAGAFMIATFYLTIGIIISYFILGAIADATSINATIFDTWWQTLLFVADIICAICLVFSLAARIVIKPEKKIKEA